MYDNLPKPQATFSVDTVGETTGHHYKGDFTVKTVLSILEKHQVELEKTRMMADYANPTAGLAGISVTVANLRVRIVKSPDWWQESGQGNNIWDENIINELFDKSMAAEGKWRESIAKKAEQAKAEQEAADKAAQESGGN
jgi:hypothetical protein